MPSVVRRPSSSAGERRSTDLGLPLERLCENAAIRPRTSGEDALKLAPALPHNDRMSALRDIRAAARERRGAGYLGGDPPSSSIPPPSPSLEAVPASSLAVSRPPPPFARPPPRQHAPFNAVFQPPARQSSALDADETRPRREHGDEAAAEGSSDAGETRTSGDAPPGGGASDEEEEARGMGSEDTARASATHAARFDAPADEDGRRAADEDGHRAADEDRRRAAASAPFVHPAPLPFASAPRPSAAAGSSQGLVAVSEVSELVASAIAGDPPRAISSAKGASADALAAVSELVRRAVTDARREGASMGATEARLALQRGASKAEKSAAAAVRAAEESARAAEEKRRVAEERRRVAEEALAGRGKTAALRDAQRTEGEAAEKMRALKARAEAASNEAAATRAELKRERQRADDAEAKVSDALRDAKGVASDKKALADLRAETKRLDAEKRALERSLAETEAALRAERTRGEAERRWFEEATLQTRSACEAAVRAVADAARATLATHSRDALGAARDEFRETKALMSAARSAVAARHRARIGVGLKREAKRREENASLRARADRFEAEAEALKRRTVDAERLASAAEHEALVRAKRLDAEATRLEREKTAEARRERDAAREALATARLEAAAATEAAATADVEAEAAWSALAEAEEAARKEGERVKAHAEAACAEAARRVEAEARALRERMPNGKPTRGRGASDGGDGWDATRLASAANACERRVVEAEADARCADAASAEGSAARAILELARAERRVVRALLENASRPGRERLEAGKGAKKTVARRPETQAEATAAPEPCESPEVGRARKMGGTRSVDSPKLTMSDEDVLEMLNP